MNCLQCGTENPQDAGFCFKCGARFGATTSSTSETLAERLQRLIPQKYAERLRATRGQLGHERRLVTILFCDVKGSTALAEGLDPEEVLEIMDGAFEFLIAPVYRHEGTLARLMGDAILAFFGAPLAHEDDPERAIRASLEMVAGAQAYAQKLEQERGIGGFSVRVGIHTGQVVVGEVGSDLRAEYTAMGDSVNLAARMEQAAPPGGILITHDTYRHVRGVFDVQPQPPLQVKGKSQPVQSYLVERAKPRAWRMASRGVEGIETRMVGREAELLMLQQAYREAVDGREARVVTVVGEPGVGKSRLLDEFTVWVELAREQVWYLRGRASAEGRGVPYSLWRDLFAYRFDILETDSTAAALAKFRAGMAGLLEPGRADLVGHLAGFDFSTSPHVAGLLGSESFGQMAFAYLVQYLRGLAGQGPAVMLLEDLHWADDSSLDLLAQVVERLPDAPLLVVGAARPELFERRPNWGEGQEAYNRLELKPLSRGASRALVREILQRVHDVPEAVQQLVVEGAEGNPFYAEELVKMLIEDGVVVPGEEEWRVELERLAEVRVPPTLTAVLQARLDALPREEKEVLQRASVVGREFWGSLLGELASDAVGPDEVRPLLESLRGRELVYRRERSAFAGTEEYLFKHALLRDVTYDTVLLKLRRRYHRQVAAWLEGHAGERLGEYLGLIAGHYDLAGEREKAAGYLRQAGESAAARYANQEALAYLDRALALLPETDLAGRYGLLLAREQVYDLLGRRDAQRQDLAEMEILAQGLGAEQQAEVAVRRSRYAMGTGDLPASMAAAQAALEWARAAGHAGLEAQGYLRWASGLGLQSDYAAARGHAEAALLLAQAAGLPNAEALALVYLGNACLSQDDLARGRHYYEQALYLYQQIGDRRGAGIALYNLGILCKGLGDYAEAWARMEQYLHDSREIGDRQGEMSALWGCGHVRWLLGDYTQAQEYTEQSLGAAREIEALDWEASALWGLGELRRCVDDFANAQECTEQALGLFQQMGDLEGEALALDLLGGLHQDQGDLATARECYEQAQGLWRKIGPLRYAMRSLAGLASGALALGDLVEAQARMAEILAYLDACGLLPADNRPFWVYLTCYQVLEAGGDPRAAEILATAYGLLQEHAARTPNEEMRRSFLENVAENREIVAEFARSQQAQ